MLVWLSAPSRASFFVSALSDLNCNIIVNWGYWECRSQADRQPWFPALTALHQSKKDTIFQSASRSATDCSEVSWGPVLKFSQNFQYFVFLMRMEIKKVFQIDVVLPWITTASVISASPLFTSTFSAFRKLFQSHRNNTVWLFHRLSSTSHGR